MTDVINVANAGTPGRADGATDATWMQRLGRHFRDLRAAHPEDELVVVFDIDGTIIDTRHLVRSVLLDYDRAHGTTHFRRLDVSEIDVHEGQVGPLLERWDLSDDERSRVRTYYELEMWTPEATLSAHQPYRGVMEVIRWFQLQPRTTVALNTGRPEELRQPTMQALRTLASEYRVRFPGELLLMNPRPQGQGVTNGKVEALEELERRGYRIVAVVDNEPENLAVMAEADASGDILFLHASTIFLSAVRPVPRTVVGTAYEIDALVEPREMQGHVQLVANGVSDRDTLGRALAEPIRWIGTAVDCDPYGRIELAAGPDSDLEFDEVLSEVRRAQRSIRIELGQPGLAADALGAVERHGFADPEVWFHAPLERLGESGIRTLRSRYPGATISCPVDFLAPLVSAALEQAIGTLDLLRHWGVTRVSLHWEQPNVRRLIAALESWGREVDIYGVGDRTSALEAAVLLPRSVTCDLAAL